MYNKSFIWIFIISIIAVPIACFIAVRWFENRFQKLPVMGGANHVITEFEMTSASGKKVTLEDWNNKIAVVDFFFTHCPTICPKMTSNLKKVQEAFPGNQELLINSFTVDPSRDNPTRLSDFARRLHIDTANWYLLTGDKREIYRIARKSFMVSATDGDGGPDDFIHSDQFVLIDRQKRIRGYYSGTNEKAVDQLISDIKKLLEE